MFTYKKTVKFNRFFEALQLLVLLIFPFVFSVGRSFIVFSLFCSLSSGILYMALFKRRSSAGVPRIRFLVFALSVFSIEGFLFTLMSSHHPPDPQFIVDPIINEDFQRVNWLAEFPPLDAEASLQIPLLTVSVVFVAHGEENYIYRTIKSVYDSTDPNYLKEVILVDDATNPPLLPLVGEHFKDVIVLRHEVQQGLIRSKTHGAAISKGDIVMFLDAHVNAEPGWYEPILNMIRANYKRVVVPLIPILNGDTWTVTSNAVGIKMMFDWSLAFDWFDDGNDLVPMLSGGLLAISRRWWFESGEYDPGMKLWGAENIEQSLRIWLCGGEIMVARSSRVSHVFRPKFPYAINDTQVFINKVRAVEVWFDNYKENVYAVDPNLKTLIPHIGDISARLELKKHLKCKPFQNYVDRFHDVFLTRGLLPMKKFKIKVKLSGLCLAVAGNNLAAVTCEDSERQLFSTSMGWGGITAVGKKLCFDANGQLSDKVGHPLLLFDCQKSNPNQLWKFLDNGEIRWRDVCLQVNESNQIIFAACRSLRANGAGVFLNIPIDSVKNI